jgi:pimeloyl-ACP methyl ester carboxylesterase
MTATKSVTAGGLEFGYLSDGPEDGPLALLLHGLPDSPHTWRHLLPELAERGYHAVAPFMRGYAPTAIPADGAYQTGALAADANALHEALGGGPDAVLIGHDWGAGATYPAASGTRRHRTSA